MPSTFPPPSVERHHSRRHSRRQSARYDGDGVGDVEAQTGNYSNRPSSAHYNDGVTAAAAAPPPPPPPNQAYEPRSSYETPIRDPSLHQSTSRGGPTPATTSAFRTLDPGRQQQQQKYTPDPDLIQTHRRDNLEHGSSSYPPSSTPHPSTTNHSHHPRSPVRNNRHNHHHHQPTKRTLLPSFLTRSRNTNNTNAQPPPPSSHHRILRAHLVATSGELVGTILFLWFSLTTATVATLTNPSPDRLPNPSTLLFTALGFGFSLAVTAWAFYRISGGLFNPAVVLGLCVAGSLPWARGLCLVPAQLVAGVLAAALVEVMVPGGVGVVVTELGPGVNVAQGLFVEMFLTALLVFTVLMLAAEKHLATFIAPVGIGLALFVAELAGIYFTGGSLNPARSFGPAVVARSFPSYHWIYWLGPTMGALLAAAYYRLVKYLNYEEANPGQDAKHE